MNFLTETNDGVEGKTMPTQSFMSSSMLQNVLTLFTLWHVFLTRLSYPGKLLGHTRQKFS